MLLHQDSGYKIKEGYVEIIGEIKLRLLAGIGGMMSTRIERLGYRGGRMILWIYKRIPRPKPYQPRDIIAIDVDERKLAYGDYEINKNIDKTIGRAHR